MDKIIVEVGSTCTKVDKFNGNNIEKLESVTIQFKKHYNEDGSIREKDIKKLIQYINDLKNISKDIYVCGTSIFRTLENSEKNNFLRRFKNETGYDFNIISQEKENELTVFGTTRFVKDKVCVFIGGGGSTEIAIYDEEIKESVNTQIGVIDVMQEFPNLAEDYATTNIEDVKRFIKSRLNLPKEKADILILAGGGHERFARCSGIKYEENSLYNDEASPIMMDIETRKKETERYYKSISLDNIRNSVKDPDWWYATRAMAAFVLVVAEEIGAKYVIPTDIAMVYGIIKNDWCKKKAWQPGWEYIIENNTTSNIFVLHSLNGDTLKIWGQDIKENFEGKMDVIMPEFPIRAESRYEKFKEILEIYIKNGTLNSNSIIIAHSIGNPYFIRFAKEMDFKPKAYIAVAPGAVYEYPSTRNDYIVEVKKQAYLKQDAFEYVKNNIKIKYCLYSDEDDKNTEKFTRFITDTNSIGIYLKDYNHFDGYHNIQKIPELTELINSLI